MRFLPLHADFGVEVLDFDVQTGGSPGEIEELRQAYDSHSMLLFRGGGRVSPERQVEIASWFGPPPPVANAGNDDFVSVLDNDDWAGSAKLPFHSDLTYTDAPIRAICLHAISLPDVRTSTTFVSGSAAWDDLPTGLQGELSALTLRHVLNSRMPDYDWPVFIADHPVRFIHPRTGRPVLFVTEHHADRIYEFDEGRSREMIEFLLGQLYVPERQFVHWWQLDDLLMWDNLVLQHARTETADPDSGRRALQRVALSEVALPELVERARARQAAA